MSWSKEFDLLLVSIFSGCPLGCFEYIYVFQGQFGLLWVSLYFPVFRALLVAKTSGEPLIVRFDYSDNVMGQHCTILEISLGSWRPFGW